MTDKTSRKKCPRDSNQLAKCILEIAMDEEKDREPTPRGTGQGPRRRRTGAEPRLGRPEPRALDIARRAAEALAAQLPSVSRKWQPGHEARLNELRRAEQSHDADAYADASRAFRKPSCQAIARIDPVE